MKLEDCKPGLKVRANGYQYEIITVKTDKRIKAPVFVKQLTGRGAGTVGNFKPATLERVK